MWFQFPRIKNCISSYHFFSCSVEFWLKIRMTSRNVEDVERVQTPNNSKIVELEILLDLHFFTRIIYLWFLLSQAADSQIVSDYVRYYLHQHTWVNACCFISSTLYMLLIVVYKWLFGAVFAKLVVDVSRAEAKKNLPAIYLAWY